MMKFETQSVSIYIKSEKLSGTLFVPQSKNQNLLPSVVIFHGRGSNKKRYFDRAQSLAEKGFLTLVFDFRGCGESDGKFSNQTIAKGFEDALAGYDFLVSHKLCDKNQIGVLGGSFGGYQAALLTEKRPVSSLILAAPAIYQDEWWNAVPEKMDPERKALYRQQADIRNTKAIKVIKKYSGQILIVEHENDEVIPKRITKVYYENTINSSLREKQIIKEAPHALHDQKYLTQSSEIITSWFLKTLTNK